MTSMKAHRLGRIATILVVTACASATATQSAPYQVATSKASPPTLPPAASAPVAQQSGSNAPPSMGPAQPSIVGMPSTRVTISATNEDVASVVARMARQVGLTAIIDPAVHGPVNRSLQNVSLNDAMASIVGDRYQYQVRNGALIVTPVQLVQHTYTVDYLAMSRVSTGATLVSRGVQGAAAATSVGGAAAVSPLVTSGTDVIESSSQTDVWGELAQQLESIVFGNASDSARTFSLGRGSRSYSRCEGQSCLRISPLTSLVDVTATPEKQEQVGRYIGLFSAAIGRQVMIKAQVVEVTLDRQHNFGIDWQAVLSAARGVVTVNNKSGFNTDPASTVSGGTASFNLGLGDFTLKAVMTALESVGDVQVVAKPMTNALNQQRASFNVTRQEQFYTTTRTPILTNTGTPTGQYSESQSIQVATVGLVFDVLPQISDKNVVMMAIRPSVTSLASRTQVVAADGTIQATLPVTEHRESDTMARVRSGETIVIGGLIQKQTSTRRTGFPILMNLPLLGRVFSSTKIDERNSELVIFLTPEIISGQPPGAP